MKTFFKNRQVRSRTITLEQLENRQLLAADIGNLLARGNLVAPQGHTAGVIVSCGLVGQYEFEGIPKVNASQAAAKTNSQAPLFAPLADTFRLHSYPSATKVIYLDFDGHTTANTQWNTNYNNGLPFTQTAFSFEGGNEFSSAELTRIQAIWQRVVEDFAPFDVDVTTQEPTLENLRNTGSSDKQWGIRVVVGSTFAPFGNYGGVAYLDSFNASSDTPALVFEDNLGNGNEKFVAEAISHEVGHSLGLQHDGRNSPQEEYYAGRNGWAPIMGVGYSQGLTQWSKGEYQGASNREDDLRIITTRNGFDYRPDDFVNSSTGASLIGGVTSNGIRKVEQSGLISTNTDTDWFKIVTTKTGAINLKIVGGPVDTNLNIKAELYDSNGNLVRSSDLQGNPTAEINLTVPAGTYYLKIDGVGEGDVNATGYSDYGSLGQYRITGTFNHGSVNPPPKGDLLGVWRNTNSILDSGNRGFEGFEDLTTYQFGLPGDIPVVGDWNNDGIDDLGVFRNGTFILDSGARGYEGFEHLKTYQFGLPGDVPVIGDWNADGIDDLGVYRNGTFIIDSGARGFEGFEKAYQFGLPGDIPVVGDWDGDGDDDFGVWRKGNFILDSGKRGFEGTEDRTPYQFGLIGDTPVIGDWDGNGKDDLGVWRNGNFILDSGRRGFEGFEDLTPFQFGLKGDIPIIGRWGTNTSSSQSKPVASPSPMLIASGSSQWGNFDTKAKELVFEGLSRAASDAPAGNEGNRAGGVKLKTTGSEQQATGQYCAAIPVRPSLTLQARASDHSTRDSLFAELGEGGMF